MAPKLFFLLTLLISISLSTIEAGSGGFTVDLIHRDSLLSPFYNPSDTTYDRLRNAVRRSITRINHFNPSSVSPNDVESTVISNGGEYLMKFSIGTPPVEILGIADTGSDLIWTQCSPCSQCYEQIAPLFDPTNSSSYKNLSCSSKPCEDLGTTKCGFGNCKYTYSYGDQSFTNGDLATDMFTFDSTARRRPVSIKTMVFGCGHNNDGTFDKRGSGLVGLGGGSLSLVSQLGSTIDGKFSYCLVPLEAKSNSSSKLNFGDHALVSGDGVVSTPMVAKYPDTFYYLTLESISVGDKNVAYTPSPSPNAAINVSNEGNIIIDSGTTLTYLPTELYDDVESALKKAIDLEPVSDPQENFGLCYKYSTTGFDVPIVTVHFTGASVHLQPMNTFMRIDEDHVCFLMVPSDGTGIFGNLAQMNFLVGYDLVNKKVSFKEADCTKN